jgi:hypothetical protein
MKIEGSGTGSISQRHGSTDPDPHQNVMDPQHCRDVSEDLGKTLLGDWELGRK